MSDERMLLLTFDQFIYAEFEDGEGEQQLRLFFATHEVLIRGHSLRRIETALQRMELPYLGSVPGNYRSTPVEGQPVVREIVVTEVNDADNKSESESH